METDLQRIEAKVDKLTDAVQRLILIEERQSTQGERIGKCESTFAVHDAQIVKLDKKIDMWVNRGIGVWSVAVVLFALAQFGARWMK